MQLEAAGKFYFLDHELTNGARDTFLVEEDSEEDDWDFLYRI